MPRCQLIKIDHEINVPAEKNCHAKRTQEQGDKSTLRTHPGVLPPIIFAIQFTPIVKYMAHIISSIKSRAN